MQQRDYIERLIEQIAALIARIASAAQNGDPREAEAALDAAWGALGLRWTDAMRLDNATLRMLLGGKAALAANLFEAQAELEDARSNAKLADGLRSRATVLRG
jgi:hypothetical protein